MTPKIQVDWEHWLLSSPAQAGSRDRCGGSRLVWLRLIRLPNYSFCGNRFFPKCLKKPPILFCSHLETKMFQLISICLIRIHRLHISTYETCFHLSQGANYEPFRISNILHGGYVPTTVPSTATESMVWEFIFVDYLSLALFNQPCLGSRGVLGPVATSWPSSSVLHWQCLPHCQLGCH